MPQTLEAPAEQRTGTDRRIDQVGLVAELQKHHADDLKTAVKSRMLEQELARVEGDLFAGLLFATNGAEVDVAKFFKLFEQDKISKKDLLACISVSRSSASKVLGGQAIEKLLVPKPANHSLRVERIKAAPFDLVEAARKLAVA